MTRAAEARAPDAATVTTRRDGETLVVELTGSWGLRSGLPSTAPVEEALAATPSPRSVTFEASGLTAWDSSALAVLDGIAASCAERKIEMDPAGLPEGLRRLLALTTAVPATTDAGAEAAPPPWLARVGLAAQGAWEGTKAAIRFLGEATLSFWRFLRGASSLPVARRHADPAGERHRTRSASSR